MTQPVSIDQVIEELTTFARNEQALLEALGRDADDGIHASEQRAEEPLAAAKERFTQFRDYLLGEAHAAVDAGEAYVRDNPWKAIAIAVGIGYLVGTLISRRRSGSPARDVPHE